jgi:hypothetical protein
MAMSEPLVPVFDLGGVFVDWNPMYLFRKLFDSEEEAQWFHDTICTSAWNLEFDAGDIYAEGVARLITRFPRYWREIQAYDLRWKETFGDFIQGTIDIHDELVEANGRSWKSSTASWFRGWSGW